MTEPDGRPGQWYLHLFDERQPDRVALLEQQASQNRRRHLGVTQPAVSQHLRLLKNIGLVKGEKRGYRVHYFIIREAMDKAQELISQALQISEGESGGNSLEELESETE